MHDITESPFMLHRCFASEEITGPALRLDESIFASSPRVEQLETHGTKNATPQISGIQSPSNEKRLVIQPGTTVDKYCIEPLIGQGGFAVVYKAKHNILQTDVALKIIRPKLSRQNPNLIRSVCKEARFAAQINHPNVVKVLDATGNKNSPISSWNSLTVLLCNSSLSLKVDYKQPLC